MTKTETPTNTVNPLTRDISRFQNFGPEPLEKLRSKPCSSGFSYLNSAEMAAHDRAGLSDVMIPEIIARNTLV